MSRFDDITDIKIILPTRIFENEITTLAVELHRYIDETIFPRIKIIVSPLASDSNEGCTVLNNYITFPITDYSGQYQDVSFVVENGFDGLITTEWSQKPDLDGKINTWAILNLVENTYVDINYFSIIVGDEYIGPKNISISSYDIYGKWGEIGNFTNITYNQINEYIYSSSYPLYDQEFSLNKKFMININSIYSNVLFITDIIFSLCPIRICEKSETMNLPQGISGDIITKSCEIGSGEQIFECQNVKMPKWIQKSNNCIYDSPKVINQEYEYIFVVGKKYSEIYLATFSGNNLTYYYHPNINGLYIDEKIGYFSGQTIEAKEIIIVIFATNPYGLTGYANIKLFINPTTLPVIINPVSKLELELMSHINKQVFDIIGNVDTVSCKGLPKNLIFNSEDYRIKGRVIEVGTFVIYFRVTNKYGNVDISLDLIVNTPLIPTIISQNEVNIFYGEEYSNIYPIECISNDFHYEVSNTLPKSIFYNLTTGELYGKVDTYPSLLYYTFKCVNEYGYDYRNITINITLSDYPIILDGLSEVLIVCGEEYNELQVVEVAGINLTYSISPRIFYL